MFQPYPTKARTALVVVAYGVGERLIHCLDSLIGHESDTDFTIVCVVNADGPTVPETAAIPAGVQVVPLPTNLGWAGGLHVGRREIDAEYMVWVQDDMVVLPGWLDALVAAADANADAGAFGSVGVDDDGRANGFAAGDAWPPAEFDRWNETDRTRESLPGAVTRYDWVTSKGMLARVSAWDELGGTDPRLFPLNHVDKDFCAHLRCHGWGVALVPTARLRHAGNQTSPGPLRDFLRDWQSERLARRWGPPLTALAAGAEAPVAHECSSWPTLEEVERLSGREASILLVPFNRAVRHRLAESNRAVQAAEAELAATRDTLSWRVTAPLRWLRRRVGR